MARLSDEQYGMFCAVVDDFKFRVRKLDIPLENAIEILNRANRGHGYLGNQITEGDDIRLAIEALESRGASEIEIAIQATGMAAIGARFDRVPAKYRILASIVVDALDYNGESTNQYVRGRFFYYLPTSHGKQFDYWHELASGDDELDFPNTTAPADVNGFVKRMLTNVGGPVLEKVHKDTIIYLILNGRVLTDDGTNIS